MFDVCVIGHVVRDINTIGGAEYDPRPGGAAYYSTMVYTRLGLRTAVLTKVSGNDEPQLLGEPRAAGVKVFNRPTERTTTFRNFYAPDNADVRIQRVDSRADRLTVADMPKIRARVWQIGPLTDQDIDPAIIVHCARRGDAVAMDVQGLTRCIVAGEVRASEPWRGAGYLRDVDVLKADEDEILIYTGCCTICEAAAKVRRAGVGEVLITCGSRGSIVFADGDPLEIDAVSPRRVVDATGCGDTYLAAYMVRRMTGADLRECGSFASAAASLNIENLGAFRGSAREIAERRIGLEHAAARQSAESMQDQPFSTVEPPPGRRLPRDN